MKIEILLFILGNLAAIFGQDSDDEEIEVDRADALSIHIQTPSGPIIGTITRVLALYVKTFLGIPYARPPVGNLRFARTVPVDPWSEALNATTMPLACIQYTTYPYPWYDFEPEKSEDCLYLNIWTPVDAALGTNKSVMFYIHGGESFGSNRKDVYDGRALAGLGDVIVVIPNYRLNLFVFLTSATRDLPGNYGIWDILEALKWVRRNIESFGGDPNQITLHGQSSGALILSMLCLSPLTKGLFSKAILQSSSVIYIQTNPSDLNVKVSQRIAKTVGCATNERNIQSDTESVVSCLRRKDGLYLARVLNSFNPASDMSFLPQYGDELFPNPPYEDIKKGRFHQIPLLIGYNSNEGVTEVTSNPELFGFFGDSTPMINKTSAKFRLQNVFLGKSCSIDSVGSYYFNTIGDNDFFNIRQQLYVAYGDIVFACPTTFFAERYAQRNNTVYFYLYTHRPSITPWAPWIGVTHFDEVQFVFGQPIRDRGRYTLHEFDLSMKLVKFWTNFAKHGTPIYLFPWPKYSPNDRSLIILDSSFNGIRRGTNPSMESCNFLRKCFTF